MKTIKEMREIAERATPGPWHVDRPFLSLGHMTVAGVMPRANLHPEEPYRVETMHTHGTKSFSKHVAVPALDRNADDKSDAARNMEFIATFNPATVLKLLEALAMAREGLRVVLATEHTPYCDGPECSCHLGSTEDYLTKVDEILNG